jgi:peptidoglycan hydrolase-like protein with peptidoglycan-binding domain
VSLGKGDPGGASYGTYQLASKPGTVREYLKQSRFGHHFKGLTPATSEFNDRWKKVAREEPEFGADQHDFIRRSHVDKITSLLSKRALDMSGRGPAVQDMIWSTAVQYRGNAPRIINRGLREAFGEGYDLAALSDVEIVGAVQDSKLLHVNTDFKSSEPPTRLGVETRIPMERAALIHLAEIGVIASNADFDRYWSVAAPIGRKSSSSRVMELQEKLLEAGVLDSRGERITADGDFGPATQQALHAFQRSVDIPESDTAGALTIHMLDRSNSVRRYLAEVAAETRYETLACRLDDHSHPDHPLFTQARERVAELDRSLGRPPDRYTDSISSALAVQARADGLNHIDKVALSDDGRELWGVQLAPGRTDNLFSLRATVPTTEAMSPMEEIAARWPEAMRRFAVHEQARAESLSIGQRDADYLREGQKRDSMSPYDVLVPEVTPTAPFVGAAYAHPADQAVVPAKPEASGQPDRGGVRELQENLNTLGVRDMAGKPLAINGTYDIATETAVARFQSEHKLPVTGIADEATQTKIQGEAFIAELQQPGQMIVSRHHQGPERGAHVQVSDSQSQAVPARLPESRSDPRNPDSPNHELYNELGRCLPDPSEERLMQFTAVCHRHRIAARNLSGVHIDYDGMTVSFDSHGLLATPAMVDLSLPPPEPEQSIQQIEQFGQQMAQIFQESRERSAQMSQQGPVL